LTTTKKPTYGGQIILYKESNVKELKTINKRKISMTKNLTTRKSCKANNTTGS